MAAKLEHNLHNAIKFMKPWQPVIQMATSEIERRFEDLDQLLSAITELESACMEEEGEHQYNINTNPVW